MDEFRMKLRALLVIDTLERKGRFALDRLALRSELFVSKHEGPTRSAGIAFANQQSLHMKSDEIDQSYATPSI